MDQVSERGYGYNTQLMRGKKIFSRRKSMRKLTTSKRKARPAGAYSRPCKRCWGREGAEKRRGEWGRLLALKPTLYMLLSLLEEKY